MSNLIGIPAVKGNSQEVISVSLSDALIASALCVGGRAVMLSATQDGMAMPEVDLLIDNTSVVEGFLVSVDKVRKCGTVIKKGIGIPLDALEAITANGAVYVDPATGKPTAVSTSNIAIGAMFVNSASGVVDASGVDATYPCHINMNSNF
jgi:hypothetical protein